MIVLQMIFIAIIGITLGIIAQRIIQKCIYSDHDRRGASIGVNFILIQSLFFISIIPGLILYKSYYEKNKIINDAMITVYNTGYIQAVIDTSKDITNVYDYQAYMFSKLNTISDDVKLKGKVVK